MDDKNKKNKGYYASLSGFKRAVPIILFALAAFIAICFISEGAGALGSGINSVLLGLFSAGAYSIPFLLLIHAIFYAEDVAKKRVISRIVFSAVTVLFVCAIEYSITFFGKEMVFAPIEFFNSKTAGGFIGSTVAFGLVKALGHIGVYILAVAMVAIYISFFFANKNSSFGRAVFAVLGFFAGILALIERAIKGIFDLFKKSKEKKSRKESDKKSRALLDDQFFKVDDGIRELKVSEPSAQIESSVAEQSQNIQSDATVFSSQEAKQKRSFSLDYGLENGEFDVIFEKEIKSKEAISFQSGLEEKKSDTRTCLIIVLVIQACLHHRNLRTQ